MFHTAPKLCLTHYFQLLLLSFIFCSKPGHGIQCFSELRVLLWKLEEEIVGTGDLQLFDEKHTPTET